MNASILDRQHPRCRNRPSATAARLWNMALSPDVMNGAESAPASKFTSNFALSTATLSLTLFSRPPLPLESLSTICTRSLHQRISVRLSTLFCCPSLSEFRRRARRFSFFNTCADFLFRGGLVVRSLWVSYLLGYFAIYWSLVLDRDKINNSLSLTTTLRSVHHG